MGIFSVMQDLGYHLYFMTDPELRRQHEKDLLAEYHAALSKYLDPELDKALTLEALIKEYEDHRQFYVIIALIVSRRYILRS